MITMFHFLELFKNAILNTGPILWNTIESNMKMWSKIDIFKRPHKQYTYSQKTRQYNIAEVLSIDNVD